MAITKKLKGLRGNLGTPQENRQNPHVFSIEGIMMLGLASIFDILNVILGILDFFLVGIILSPFLNAFASATLGTWLLLRTGHRPGRKKRGIWKMVLKRVALPFFGNSIPLSKFFFWWVWAVWSSLDKGMTSAPALQPST